MRVIALDFETYYDSECSVRDLAPRAYVNHPSFYAYMVSASDGEETWAGNFEDFNTESLRGNTVVSHNASFERAIAEHYWGLSKLGVKSWECTANLSSFLCGRRALSDAVEYLFGFQISKRMRDYMKGRHWNMVRGTPEGDKLLAYARDDVIWCRKIWTDYVDTWSPFERQLSLATLESSANGIRVDRPLLFKFRDAIIAELVGIELKLPWIKDGYKPTSTKAIVGECRRLKIPCPPVKDEDEDLYNEWERTYQDEFPWVLKVGEWRSVNKLLGTVEKLVARTDDDGEMDTPLKYFGAHTGRWSGDNGVNLQNFRKDALVCGNIPIELRHLLIARPGHKLIVADYTQIEPRCQAWLVGDWDFLKLVSTGMSPYEAHARQTMGWTGGGPLRAENPGVYALAKARVLALGYGCGYQKFITMAWEYCKLQLSEEQSARIVTDFREQNPKITGLWARLESGLNNSRKGIFEVVLPSGRKLVYSEIKTSLRVSRRKNPKTGEFETTKRFATTAVSGARRSFFYGGKLTENLVQACARDVFAEGLLAVRDAGFKILFHVHDEIIVEVPETTPVQEITRLMEVTPSWMPGLPVAVEAIETPYYHK